MEWHLNRIYNIGDKVLYNKKYYKCIQMHESLLEYGFPDQTNGVLWSDDRGILNSDENITIWGINKVYKKGDIVKFDYNLYYCIKNNLSNIMNSPPHTRDNLWGLYKLETCKL